MKCQRCTKQATLHITEILGDEQFEELHFCEECAKRYLNEQQTRTAETPNVLATPDLHLEPGEKACEVCGMKFVEFRNGGRLGCAHDYEAFREELLLLFESIHGEVHHVGKHPRRMPKTKGAPMELAGLRKKLQQAVLDEAYETAAKLRDRIREIEEG